jgi:hypothetical protein
MKVIDVLVKLGWKRGSGFRPLAGKWDERCVTNLK